MISSALPPFYEEGLEKSLKNAIQNKLLRVSSKISKFNRNKSKSRIYIITIGTHIKKDNKLSSNIVNDFIKNELNNFLDGDLIILRSTVSVGTSLRITKIFNKNNLKVSVCYCPERTIEGNALKELSTLPQIISSSDTQSLIIAEGLFKSLTKEIIKTSLEEAELAKLISNVQRDLTFAFSNEVLKLCNDLKCNFEIVKNALNYNYPRSDLKDYGPVAGPCLEKDAYILFESLKKRSKKNFLFYKARKLNEDFIEILMNYLKKLNYDKFQKISLTGIAFKGLPKTNDFRGSYIFNLIERFSEDDKEIYIYDSFINYSEFKNSTKKKTNIKLFTSPLKFLKETELLISQNESKQFDIAQISQASFMRSIPLNWISLHPWQKTYNINEINIIKKIKRINLIDLGVINNINEN